MTHFTPEESLTSPSPKALDFVLQFAHNYRSLQLGDEKTLAWGHC